MENHPENLIILSILIQTFGERIMASMSRSGIDEFLSQQHLAHLVTLRPSGRLTSRRCGTCGTRTRW